MSRAPAPRRAELRGSPRLTPGAARSEFRREGKLGGGAPAVFGDERRELSGATLIAALADAFAAGAAGTLTVRERVLVATDAAARLGELATLGVGSYGVAAMSVLALWRKYQV